MANKDFDFKKMQEKIEKVLGQEFVSEMNKILPKKGPAIDMYETDEFVFVAIEAPGINRNDDAFDLYIEGYKLYVKIDIPYTYPVLNHELKQSERKFGTFKREVILPYTISPDEGIKATYENGILLIKITKKTNLKDEKIKVEFD